MDNISRIHAQDVDITIRAVGGEDYISLTDMARHESSRPAEVIRRWLRNSDTIQFLTAWEHISNPDFDEHAAAAIQAKSGRNVFSLSSAEWVDQTHAIGIRAERGRSGGTYAHKDIAFAFASWISPEFHLFIIKDYQRLKAAEQQRSGIEWQARRELAKTNYRLHTDAVKDTLQSRDLPKWRERLAYASEADVINLAVFGQKASEWKSTHEGWKGNMRDYASVRDLVILQNIEALSAMFIQQGYDKARRYEMLKREADRQREKLADDVPAMERLRAIIESTETIQGQVESASNGDEGNLE
ncbi:MAG: KilA-N domain-containing protein [Bifidobacterium scardovii]|uniref:KilA-N domain-containing protein n=1 Tax=Bifidobacterium scardovii TaxID=158787 RepID=UPI002901ABFA|nr:KilA-N domain-containing protein [Bifidobacterium scardovii]MDU2421909.1 KilA-N domain-containing protein [Bifidobacterium scardovii]